jgi:hypothetical protein
MFLKVCIRALAPSPSLECPQPPALSHRMYLSISFRKPTPLRNRQFDISISNSERQVDDFVGELTFQNQLINTFDETKSLPQCYTRTALGRGCRANSVHARQSRPDAGLGFQAKVPTTSELFPPGSAAATSPDWS